MIALYGCSFVNVYDIDTLRMNYLLQDSVPHVYSSHFWTRSNAHAIREPGYQVQFKVAIWSYIVRDIVVCLYLPDRLAV
jgi:hypothetical protein